MRLMDLIGHAKAPLVLKDSYKQTLTCAAVLDAAPLVRNCPVRYVLDTRASAQCRDLVVSARELFRPDDDFLRVPAERFWIEWFGDPPDEALAGPRGCDRMGALVEADAGGRRGELRLFWPEGSGAALGATIVFDLDRRIKVPERSTELFRIRHRELGHLNTLLQHTALRLSPEWARFMAAWTEQERATRMAALAAGSWHALPIVLAFSAMLNSGGLLEPRQTNLARLNKARAGRQRPPLLEHIEIGMQLGFGRVAGFGGLPGADRRTPRLHYVRGHLVRRSGKTFWRTSHLRGDPVAPMVQRTVQFSGQGRVSSEASQRC